MKCATHPNVDTNLRCGKCGKPICPKCLVQTPVGARCRECANVKPLVTYQLSPMYYARATGAGLASGAISGVIWAFIPLWGLLNFFLAAGVGFLIAEAVSLSVNHKRGRALQVIASIGMVLSYLARSWMLHRMTVSGLLDLYGLIALGVGIIVVVSRLR